jgi:hypothetical protein
MILLNIGLNTNNGTIDGIDAFAAVDVDMTTALDIAVHQSNTEPTAVIRIAKALTKAQIETLCEKLGQEAIAQHDGETGVLYGPQAEKWGAFNPEFFLMMDGTTLASKTGEPA